MVLYSQVSTPMHTEQPLGLNQAIPYHIKRTRKTPRKDTPPAQPLKIACRRFYHNEEVHLVDDEYLVTAFVPSETACFANSPGRMSRTLYNSEDLTYP